MRYDRNTHHGTFRNRAHLRPSCSRRRVGQVAAGKPHAGTRRRSYCSIPLCRYRPSAAPGSGHCCQLAANTPQLQQKELIGDKHIQPFPENVSYSLHDYTLRSMQAFRFLLYLFSTCMLPIDFTHIRIHTSIKCTIIWQWNNSIVFTKIARKPTPVRQI